MTSLLRTSGTLTVVIIQTLLLVQCEDNPPQAQAQTQTDACQTYSNKEVCQNGGTCHVNKWNEPSCACTSSYSGEFCQTKDDGDWLLFIILGGVAVGLLFVICIVGLVAIWSTRYRENRRKEKWKQIRHNFLDNYAPSNNSSETNPYNLMYSYNRKIKPTQTAIPVHPAANRAYFVAPEAPFIPDSMPNTFERDEIYRQHLDNGNHLIVTHQRPTSNTSFESIENSATMDFFS